MRLPGLTEKQKLMLAYGEAHPYAILAADPRLGKTRVAILLAKKFAPNTLVVCPAYLVPNWRREIKKWSPESSVTTFQSGKEIYDVCDSDFVVTSYDLVQRAEFLFEWADMVISDETHNLKNMAAKRTQFLHRAIYENSIKRFYELTGTPIKNRVKEFYSLMALVYYEPGCDQSFLDEYPDEITFAERFSYSDTYEINVTTKRGRRMKLPVTNYHGLRNRKELKRWLKGRYLRVRADEKDLPPISYLDTLVKDSDDANLLKAFNSFFVDESEIRKMLRGTAEKLKREVEMGRITKKESTRLKGLADREARQMRTGSVLPEHKRNAAIQKIPFTVKYVEDLLESVECCLVYSDHKEPCQTLANHFKVPAITGEMPAKQRASLVNDFQSGKIRVLCATVGSLKEGADLFRARDLVLNDPSWVPGDIFQVINRTRALGHKEPRTVHRILGSPQDAKIWEVLEAKMETINKAT